MDSIKLLNALKKNKFGFVCGVPDSLLKNFCNACSFLLDKKHYVITANEGNAVGLACGHYLITNNPAVVFMQNSGLGNTVNPLLSIADEKVYKIPMLLIIGWRGQPGIHDEPQHVTQGELTLPLLKIMGIKYEILYNLKQIEKASKYINKYSKPYALIIQKGLLNDVDCKSNSDNNYSLSREGAIKYIISKINNDIVVSTTGMISREVYENRTTHEKDFLTVGGMGHASSIALGIALECKKKVICLDGDGALLMHLGSLPVIASTKPNNYKHIVFNNLAHDSVGGQPNAMNMVDLKTAALSLGYQFVYSASSLKELDQIWDKFYNSKQLSILEIKVKCGARKDLGRPKESPQQNKKIFMEYIKCKK